MRWRWSGVRGILGRIPACWLVRPESAQKRRRIIPPKVFVGNLSYETTRDQLSELLGAAGEIRDVYLPTDRATGRPRGFAFVEFSSDAEAEEAIRKFDQFELGGRKLKINPAEERPRRPPMSRPSGGGFSSSGPSFGSDAAAARPSRPKGSRRGLRGKKRSL